MESVADKSLADTAKPAGPKKFTAQMGLILMAAMFCLIAHAFSAESIGAHAKVIQLPKAVFGRDLDGNAAESAVNESLFFNCTTTSGSAMPTPSAPSTTETTGGMTGTMSVTVISSSTNDLVSSCAAVQTVTVTITTTAGYDAASATATAGGAASSSNATGYTTVTSATTTTMTSTVGADGQTNPAIASTYTSTATTTVLVSAGSSAYPSFTAGTGTGTAVVGPSANFTYGFPPPVKPTITGAAAASGRRLGSGGGKGGFYCVVMAAVTCGIALLA